MSVWVIGAIGLLAVEGSYLPQIVRLYQRKEAEAFSYFFPALNVGGRMLALTYSLLIHQEVFSIGLFAGIALRITFFAQVAWYRRAHDAGARDAFVAAPLRQRAVRSVGFAWTRRRSPQTRLRRAGGVSRPLAGETP